MKILKPILATILLVGTVHSVAFAQASETRAILDRLATLESMIQALASQLADLTAKVRPDPPSPIEVIPPQEVNVNDAAMKGSAKATIVLIEFSDFECPFCGRHAQSSYGDIRRQYVETGKVKYVFKHFPIEQLHRFARKAAEAAECAGEQGKFWEFHDSLFANQQALSSNDLSDRARAVELDVTSFDSCLSGGKMNARVADDLAEARRLGLTATPAFVLGELGNDGTVTVTRRIIGAQSFSVFQAALDYFLVRSHIEADSGHTRNSRSAG
jgi:protein-disulfide isomerase